MTLISLDNGSKEDEGEFFEVEGKYLCFRILHHGELINMKKLCNVRMDKVLSITF